MRQVLAVLAFIGGGIGSVFFWALLLSGRAGDVFSGGPLKAISAIVIVVLALVSTSIFAGGIYGLFSV